MPPTKATTSTDDKASRSVVSIPGELVAKIDNAIKTEGGEALAKLGVSVESMRQGFVHKLLHESLDAKANGNS